MCDPLPLRASRLFAIQTDNDFRHATARTGCAGGYPRAYWIKGLRQFDTG